MKLRVSEDYSYALAGFNRRYAEMTKCLRDKKYAAAWVMLSDLQDRVEAAKWHCREQMSGQTTEP